MTDRKLSELERKIQNEYRQAEKEVKSKLDDYLRRFEVKDRIKLRQLNEGKITFEEYKKWRMGQIAIGDRWEFMRRNLAHDLANYQQIAKAMANGYMPEVYCININYTTYDIEHRARVDTSFLMYNQDAVQRIVTENPELLPPPGVQMTQKLAMRKAVKWEEGQLQSVITQAILQGESISHMADRMARTLCVSDRKAAIRYARTAITEAENAGRIDGFHRAQSMGIKLKKTWLAVLDGRTRDAHRELDGQSIPVDDYFENALGKIKAPGDPTAKPANFWNCRCGLASEIEGFETDWSDLSLRNTKKLGDMSYEEWKKAHGTSQAIETPDKIAALMKRRYIADYRR